MDLFDAAWQPVKEYFSTARFDNGKTSNYNDGTSRRLSNIRLDCEVPAKEISQAFPERHLDLIWTMLKKDLEDLYENGDTAQGQDAFLRAFAGSRSRGKELTLVAFPQVAIYREYKRRQELFDYTIYIVVYGEWE